MASRECHGTLPFSLPLILLAFGMGIKIITRIKEKFAQIESKSIV
jgi:hypothetical protein